MRQAAPRRFRTVNAVLEARSTERIARAAATCPHRQLAADAERCPNRGPATVEQQVFGHDRG